MWKAERVGMMGNRGTVIIVLGLLVVMTGVFTAYSADGGESQAADAGDEEFILVNGDEIPEGEFTSRVATVEQNIVMLNAQAENLPEDDPFVESLLEIMDATPPETVALASLILDTAVYQEAVDRGHQPDMEVIQAQVEQERELFAAIEENPAEFDIDEESVADYRENIEEVGEEAYWTEHYPSILEQQVTVESLQAEVEGSDEDWVSIQRDAFRSAEVEINDPDAVDPATHEDARSYMEAIWELTGGGGAGS